MNENENSEETREELATEGEHFESRKLRFRHIDWANERIKMLDALKMLEAEPGRGFIIWREGKPFILAADYLVKSALRLDAIAKQAEAAGQKLNSDILYLIWNETRHTMNEDFNRQFNEVYSKIGEQVQSINQETTVNPFSKREELFEALYYGDDAHELTNADYSLLLEALTERKPRIRAHLERWRKKLELSEG